MSKGNSRYWIDRYYWAIEITAANNALVWEEDGSVQTATIPAGTYYVHDDASLDADGYPSLYIALRAAIGVELGDNTYAFHLTADIAPGGLVVERLSGSMPWAIHFGDAATTLDPRLLGWGEGAANTTLENTDEVFSPFSAYGVWQSPHAADNKRDTRKQSVMSSSPDPVNRYVNPWVGHRRRPIFYRAVPAGHVRRWAAEDSYLAGKAGLPTGDTNNALADFLWEASASNHDVIAVYDEGDQDLQVSSHTDKYEFVRFADDSEIEGLLGIIEDRPNGEQYDLRWHFASKLTDPEYKDP